MNSTIKFYLRALFIALVAFGGTSFIIRNQQAIAPAAPAKLTITQQAPPIKPRRSGLAARDIFVRRSHGGFLGRFGGGPAPFNRIGFGARYFPSRSGAGTP